MLGTATKYFAGLTALAFVALLGYGLIEVVGRWAFDVESADYRLLGVSLFFGLVVACALLTGVGLAAGDRPSTDRVLQHDHPAQAAWWPVLAALGVAVLIVGIVADTIVTVLGLLILAFSAVQWVMTAWSERLSTDLAYNEQIRRRLVLPVSIPLFGAVVVAGGILLLSRVLLASSRNGATWTALALMIVIVGAAFVLYALPGLRRPIVIGIVAVGVLAVIVGGVIGIASGSRTFEHHGDEGQHADEPANGAEEGAMIVPSAPVRLR
jgi:hypothetical protein